MKKIAAGLFCLLSMMQAIEIDVPFIKSQALANKTDIGSRVLLMKYYFQNHAYSVAQRYMKEILALDASNPLGNKIKKKLLFIKTLQKQSMLKDASVVMMLQSIYAQKEYSEFCHLYEQSKSLGFSFDAKMDLDVADAYFKIGENDKSLALLATHHYTNSKRVKSLKDNIALSNAKKSLTNSPNKRALNDYVYLLKDRKSPHQIIKSLKEIVKNHPENIDAKIALSENLYWQGEMKNAFNTLYMVRKYNKHSLKLYTNILYDMGDYAHALYYLPDLVAEEKTSKEKFVLEKKMAFAYLHVGKEDEANNLFAKLANKYPQDEELSSILSNHEKQALLSKAVSCYKAKDMPHALAYYKRYYEKTQDPKIAKEIAEIYYFSKKEKLALPYFKAYLAVYPEDTLIRFHYASVFEKSKVFDKSATQLNKILQKKDAKEYFLAKYHYAYSLMHTFKDDDWLEARKTLSSLVAQLSSRAKASEEGILKFSRSLLKTARGPIIKPTRYKDIVLTEGSFKKINPKDVFSTDKISFTKKSSASALLPATESKKTQAWLGMDYVDDSAMMYTNYKVGFNNVVATKDMQIGIEFQNFFFDGIDKNYDGMGLFVNTQVKKWNFALGVDHYEDFDTIVPKMSWRPSIGAHSLFLEAYYRNGSFINYRNCMIKNKSNVYHLGLYDTYLLDDLTTLTAGIDVNHFEDDNTNFYGQFTLPLYHDNWLGVEHTLSLNENIEYNTKTSVCSHPTDFYDSSYLKYQPKLRFKNGYIEGILGTGYTFKNKEVVFSYGLNAAYTIEKVATFSVDCERLQSSFTSDDMTSCHINMMQAW